MQKILIVDDEDDICQVLKMLFEHDGYSVTTANDGEEAIRIVERGEFIDLIIADLKMPGIDGMGILDYLIKESKDIPLVFITAYGTISEAVEAMKKGAVDFITKPFNKNVIRHVVNRVFQIKGLEDENKLLKSTLMEDRIVYRSRAMQEIMQVVKKVAQVSSPVLILGKSGAGKEVVARAIHSFDPTKPFIKINCPAIPESLIESELFGYQKGAFTGAETNFQGKAKLADGGILFLDEIADLPLRIQPKLLRLLEDKTFEPLGSTTTITIDTRIICATNRDLEQLVKKGRFREDLLYRINTLTIKIPPLRERQEDILPLAEFFLGKYAKEMGKKTSKLSEEVKTALLQYDWPGNVREIRNVIERAMVLSNNSILNLSDFPQEIQQPNAPSFSRESDKLSQHEKLLLQEALQQCHGNISAAARELGITRDTLRYRMEKFGLMKWGKIPKSG